MLTAVAREPTHEALTTFWASPILVGIGGPDHAIELAASAARLASRSESMVVVFTVSGAERVDASTFPTGRPAWATALDRAVSTLDDYQIPYRVAVDDRLVSSVEPDRTRELAWAIWAQSRDCRAQAVVVGAHGGLEPGLQVHRHLAAAGRIPVVTVSLPKPAVHVAIA